MQMRNKNQIPSHKIKFQHYIFISTGISIYEYRNVILKECKMHHYSIIRHYDTLKNKLPSALVVRLVKILLTPMFLPVVEVVTVVVVVGDIKEICNERLI